jgi:hypothetical protein
VYDLSRVTLPRYSSRGFADGRTDFPDEALLKVASSVLSTLAPEVYDMYERFEITSSDQESILAIMMVDGVPIMQAACTWIKDVQNSRAISRWRSMPALKCESGHFIPKGLTNCEPCLAGKVSLGGAAIECVDCAPGTTRHPSLRQNDAPLFDGVACAAIRSQPNAFPELSSSTFARAFAPGFFQPESAQSTCIPCNSIGDSFYQSERGQTACLSCPAHTKIFNGIYTDPGECECKAGQKYACSIMRAPSLHALRHQAFCLGRDDHRACMESSHPSAGWYHYASSTGQVPANAFALSGLVCSSAVSKEMSISHAGVQAMYERGPRRLTIRFLVRRVCLAEFRY